MSVSSASPVTAPPAPAALTAPLRWELDLAQASARVQDRARAVQVRQAWALGAFGASIWAFDVFRLVIG